MALRVNHTDAEAHIKRYEDCSVLDSDSDSDFFKDSSADSNASSPVIEEPQIPEQPPSLEFSPRKEVEPQGPNISALTVALRDADTPAQIPKPSDDGRRNQQQKTKTISISIPTQQKRKAQAPRQQQRRKVPSKYKSDIAYLAEDHAWECCGCGARNTKWEFACSGCHVHSKKKCCRLSDGDYGSLFAGGERKVSMVRPSDRCFVVDWVLEED